MANLSITYQRFGKNFEQDDKRGMSLIVVFLRKCHFLRNQRISGKIHQRFGKI